ncbi:MAG: hypothetical protein LQ350_005491 [Teloschistes chrysophthalmus]|nr:MAG: hypothetical protein LQ350_005491 [Niorma chrysophthalma]
MASFQPGKVTAGTDELVSRRRPYVLPAGQDDEEQDHTIPQTQRSQPKLPAFKQPMVTRQDSESEDINGVSSNEDAVDLGAGLDVRSHEGDRAIRTRELLWSQTLRRIVKRVCRIITTSTRAWQSSRTIKTKLKIHRLRQQHEIERFRYRQRALRRPPIRSLGEQTRARASEDSIGRLPTNDEDQGVVEESDASQDHQESPPSLRQVDGVEDRDNVDNEPSSGEGLVEEYSVAIPTQENLQRAGRILKGRVGIEGLDYQSSSNLTYLLRKVGKSAGDFRAGSSAVS